MRRVSILLALAVAAFAHTPSRTRPGNGFESPATHVSAPAYRPAYVFVAWPRGGDPPIRFRSSVYVKDSAAFVRLDDDLLFGGSDAAIRHPGDFDSLKGAGRFYGPKRHARRDTTWYPAIATGRRWAFAKIRGRISLYTTEPGNDDYAVMDTGAGLEAYSGEAVRAKVARDPRTAPWISAMSGWRLKLRRALGLSDPIARAVGIYDGED